METLGLRMLTWRYGIECTIGVMTHVGTRMETPVTFPFNSGNTDATALAAPVVAGIILLKTPRPMRDQILYASCSRRPLT